MKLMTFDVGGTEIKYAVMNEDYFATHKGSLPTPMDSFDQFASVIRNIYLLHKDEVEGIAMSMPGFVDPAKGVIMGGGMLTYTWRRELAKELSEYCGCPVVIENDGKAAVWAEYTSGSLKGCRNAAVFVIGTGVGGGIIINGELVRGIHGTAGEYSFMISNPADVRDVCGFMAGCCSTWGLLNLYRKLKKTDEQIDGREFFRRVDKDEIAMETLNVFAGNIAKEIFNLCWLLDLERIAIGGGISRQPILTEKINEKFRALCDNNFFNEYCNYLNTEIVQAKYCNDANLIGAYMTYCKYVHNKI